MKLITRALLTLAVLATITGCASPGGYVIGPFSSMTAKSNQRAMVKRAALASKELTRVQKSQVIRAAVMTHDADEIAVMVGVDLLQLRGTTLTSGEIGRQVLGAVGDALLYGVAAWGANEAELFGPSDAGGRSSNSSDDDSQDSDDDTITITINQ